MTITRILTFSKVLLLFFTLTAATSRASYVNLGPAGDFNVFVFGNNTQHGSDVEGRLAVGGDADFTKHGSGFTIASKAAGNTTNLIVGGNYTNSSHSVKGGVLVDGNLKWYTPTISGPLNVNGNADFGNSGGEINKAVNVVGTYTAPSYYPANANPPSITPLPFDFADVENYLTSQAEFLSNLVPNGDTTLYFGQVHLTATGPLSSLYVFNVSGTDMANAAGHGLSITAPAGSTVVVNIDGPSSALASMGITLNGVDRQHVLYNFFEAKNVTLNAISVEGTVLAPLADVNFINGQINGTLIANNLTGVGESHLHLFQGTLPVVPEPATWVLGSLGAALVMLLRRKRGR